MPTTAPHALPVMPCEAIMGPSGKFCVERPDRIAATTGSKK